MKNPILLDRSSLAAMGTLRPASLSVSQVTEGLDTASMMMVIGDGPDVTVGSWVRVFTPHGDAGVYVAQETGTNLMDGTRTVELEHAFGLLGGEIIYGEITPDTVLGGANHKTVPVGDLIRYALDRQTETVWQLGRCEFDDAQGWTFTNPTILDVLETVTDSLQDWAWTFDMSRLPFVVNLVKWQKTPTCEMRMTRNISSMQITVDRSSMATRLYPIGNNGMTIGDPAYVEKNVGAWGLVAKMETDVSIEDAGLLRAWGEARLEQLCEPLVSVSINGLDWSGATGEPMDRLAIGTVCRVPLPEYGTTVMERITQLTWQDLVADETSVQITMANQRDGITNVVRQLKKSGGAGSKAAAKEDKKMWTEFVKTDERIGLEAYRIDGLQTAYSGLIVTADSITSRVGTIEGDILTIGTEIEQNKTDIALRAKQIDLEALETTVNGILFGEELLLAGDLSVNGTVDAGSLHIDNGDDSNYISGGLSVSGSLTVDGNTVATRAWVNDKAVFEGAWHYHTFKNTAGNNVGAYFWTKNDNTTG